MQCFSIDRLFFRAGGISDSVNNNYIYLSLTKKTLFMEWFHVSIGHIQTVEIEQQCGFSQSAITMLFYFLTNSITELQKLRGKAGW